MQETKDLPHVTNARLNAILNLGSNAELNLGLNLGLNNGTNSFHNERKYKLERARKIEVFLCWLLLVTSGEFVSCLFAFMVCVLDYFIWVGAEILGGKKREADRSISPIYQNRHN